MLWGVMELELAGEDPSFFGWKRFIPGGDLMGVEIIHDYPGHCGPRVQLDFVASSVTKGQGKRVLRP
jgi:hypothetical protein